MKKFTRIELGYELDALEPHISKETMDLHYNKHHAGYEAKLNETLENVQLPENIKTLKDLMMNFHQLEDDIVKVQVRRFGGGLINHNHMFTTLKKDTPLTEDMEVYKALVEHFGSIEEFKTILVRHAARLFGSGWAWLTLNNKKQFKILTTQNQDNPWMVRQVVAPLIGIDVWEHAYYVDYRNRRAEYIEEFFKVIDWQKVNQLYLEGLKALEDGTYKVIQPNRQRKSRNNRNRNNRNRNREPKVEVVLDSPRKVEETPVQVAEVKTHKERSLNDDSVVSVSPEWEQSTLDDKKKDE